MKLKPICVSNGKNELINSSEFEAINEKMALYYLICTFRSMLENQKKSTSILDGLPDEYLRELIYSFCYRDISKEALILLVESIAVLLGLEPYRKIGNKNNKN